MRLWRWVTDFLPLDYGEAIYFGLVLQRERDLDALEIEVFDRAERAGVDRATMQRLADAADWIAQDRGISIETAAEILRDTLFNDRPVRRAGVTP